MSTAIVDWIAAIPEYRCAACESPQRSTSGIPGRLIGVHSLENSLSADGSRLHREIPQAPTLSSDQSATAWRAGGNREGTWSAEMTSEPRIPAIAKPDTTGQSGGRRKAAVPNLPNRTGSSTSILVRYASTNDTARGINSSAARASGRRNLKMTIEGQCHRYSG